METIHHPQTLAMTARTQPSSEAVDVESSRDVNAPGKAAELLLSIIAPAHNEETNIACVADEVSQALTSSGLSFEFILVDDASNDSTQHRMVEQSARFPWIRVVSLERGIDGRHPGKSAALLAGICEAAGQWIAFMDADRQNNPHDLPAMLKRAFESGSDMVQGNRASSRRDNWIRRASSRVGRMFCKTVLGSQITDAGCGFAVMRREVARALPLQFCGMHRFTAFYAGMIGYKVIEAEVHHRPRVAGRSKYGIWNRAIPGLVDLFAVAWMKRRIITPPSQNNKHVQQLGKF